MSHFPYAACAFWTLHFVSLTFLLNMADDFSDMFNLTLEQECEREAEQREIERQETERRYQEAQEEEKREAEQRVRQLPDL